MNDSLHQKKVYTSVKGKYSKAKGTTRGKAIIFCEFQNECVGQSLFFTCPPSVLSTPLDKGVYFLFGETVFGMVAFLESVMGKNI